MLRPITYAPRADAGLLGRDVGLVSALVAQVPGVQPHAADAEPLSRLWSGPATNPSSEIDIWHVVSCIGSSPILRT